MRRREATTSDAEPREQTKWRRRSAGEVSPARLDFFRPHAFEPTVATWQLIVFAVISAVIPAVALLGWTLNMPRLAIKRRLDSSETQILRDIR